MQILGLGWFYNGFRVTAIIKEGIVLENGSCLELNQVEIGLCGKLPG